LIGRATAFNRDISQWMVDHARMNEALIAIVALGVFAGGAIVVIDSLILRRIRRQAPRSRGPDADDQR
jgi:hypothetical protein